MAMAAARALLLAPALAAAALAGGGSASQRGMSGVQKVIQMLTDMSAKSKQEKKDAEVAFAKFSTWCSQEIPSLEGEISKSGEQIMVLGASIQKLESDVKTLGKDIAALNGKAAMAEADLKAEKDQRAKDHDEFLAESKDYAESVDALERAIAVLQKQAYDRTGGQAALLQFSKSPELPEKARTILSAFVDTMGEDPDYSSYQAPEANAYEFQSSSIVDLLKRLTGEFKAKLSECQKEEMNSKHAHEMVVMDLADTVENAKKQIDARTIEKQRKAEDAAKDKKQLAATSNVKAESQETLQATKNDCSEHKVSYEEKQRLRAEEIEAINKAVEILSSPEVAGAAERHLTLAQLSPSATARALVQIAGGQGNADGSAGINRRVREFLAAEGQRLHSQRLGMLVQQLATDPFGKVKKMIEDLITRLQEEGHGDAEHEGFCDKELGKSKITRAELSEQIDQLTAAVDDGKATITSLAQSSATLTQEVADLTKAVAEATALRQEESKTNAATLKDAEAAQVAVEAATAVLKEFYEKAGGAALLQVQQVQQDAANGVLGLLEVIQSDFANLEANTRAAETEGQKAHETFLAESKKSKAVKERKIEMSKADQASAEAKLQEDTSDLKATQDQLLAATRYFDKLKPQCLDQGMTYEERTKSRQEEIASLRQALEILNGEDIATSAF